MGETPTDHGSLELFTASRRVTVAAILAGLLPGVSVSAAAKNTKKRRKHREHRHDASSKGKGDVHDEKKKKKKKKKKDTPTPVTTPPPTGGAGGLLSPVPAGVSYYVHHGYNDPLPGQPCDIGSRIDHCRMQQYGLDLTTASEDIVAPGAGVIAWTGGDCLGIKLNDGGANLTVCHFASFKVARNQPVAQGQCLGTKGSHVHINLYGLVADDSKPPIPFTGRYKLEGKELPPNGSQNQWLNERFVSTNPGFCSGSGPAAVRIEAAVRDLTVDRTNGAVLNFHPAHPTITAELQLLSQSNQLTTLNVDVTYNASAGAFIGIVTLPNQVTPGAYTAAVKFRDRTRTVRAQVPGVVTIRAGATASMPRITLIPADANDDNRISTADYDLIASCYTQPGGAEKCSGDRLKAADVDDNGTVNAFDLNLYTRVYT